MLMGELLTLRQLGLSVKIIVFKNGTVGFVEMEMKAAGLVETGVTLDNPDFAAMARAIGLHGVRITDPREVEAGVRDVLAYPGPALLDAAENYAGTDEGLHPLCGEGYHQRSEDSVVESGKTNAGLLNRLF